MFPWWRVASRFAMAGGERVASFVVENRVLAGLRFVDIATGAPIGLPLVLRGAPGEPRVLTSSNRRGIHVITWAEGFDAYVAAFDPPLTQPPVGDVSIVIEVRDPSGTYLPRQLSVALPREVDGAAADSVFEPITVALLRSPRATRSPNWAMIRIRLLAAATNAPLPAALLRVVHDPEGAREVLGFGMSVVADPEALNIERQRTGRARWVHFTERHVGEASVPVVGLSSQIWAVGDDEEVVLSNIAAALEVVPMTVAGPGRLPDPDAFFAAPAGAGNTRALTLSVGGEIHEPPFSVSL
jgi:hypothetical protein